MSEPIEPIANQYQNEPAHIILTGPGNVRIGIASDAFTGSGDELGQMTVDLSAALMKGNPLVLGPGWRIVGMAG